MTAPDALPAQPYTAPASPLGGRIRRAISLLILGYLLLLVGIMALEDTLIFFPSVYPEGQWNPPHLKVEDAWFDAADGTHLHGWYVPHEHPRAVVLFAHGNAGNLSHRADLLDALVRRLGVSAMFFDYRGYGRSQGKPNVTGVLEDARAARRWLAQRAGVPEAQIVLMGESLGGGVMVDLAAADGARGLVLENTFNSLPAVAAYHYPWLPVKLLMRSHLDSAAKIGKYQGPLLQFHGDSDRIIPLELGQQLFQAAREPKRLVVIAGGDHNDARRDQFYQEVDRFLSALDYDAAKAANP